MRRDVWSKIRKHALVISISDYKFLPSLKFCKNDGEAIVKSLKSIDFEIPDTNKLIGEVSWGNMREAILRFFTDQTIKPGDTLLFYFSGHGIPEGVGEHYLATSEIEPDRPYHYGYPFDDLTKCIDRDRCNSERVVLILDCCYSGSARLGGKGPQGEGNSARLGKANIDEKIKAPPGEGRYLLAACQGSQEAFSTKKGDYSIFTYYIVKGLNGADGTSVDKQGDVTADSLSKFVNNQLMNLPPKERPKQKPIRKADEASGELVLARYPQYRRTSWRSREQL